MVSEGAKKNKAKQIAAAPLRFATMPIGMLHDLATGGLIQVGKNFIPRLKNAATGSTIINRAEVMAKQPKTTTETPPTDASTGGMTDTESIREDTVLNNDSVASAVDSERVTGDATSDRNESNAVSTGGKKDDSGGDES